MTKVESHSFSENEFRDISWIVKHLKYKLKRRICLKIYNVYFSEDECNSILESIFIFKWHKCEKAGRNIYDHLSYEDQLITAGIDMLKEKANSFIK